MKDEEGVKMFNKKKIIIKTLVVFMLVAVLLIVSFIRQSDMKEKYKITYEISEMYEPMVYDGYQITVNEANLWNVDDYFNYLGPEYMSYSRYFEFYQDGELIDTSILEVKLNVKKIEESVKDHGVHEFALTMENAYTAYDPQLTVQLSKCDTKYNLDIGESQEYTVVYNVLKNSLTEEQWENRDNIEYMLVSSVYPVHKAINLTNITNKSDGYVLVEYDETDIEATVETNTITDYSEALFDSDLREFLDGGNEVYAYGQETMKAGFFEVTLKELDYIYNIEELYRLMDDAGYDYGVEEHINCFDSVTGEVLPERNLSFFTATVEVKNIGDEMRTFNLFQGGMLSADLVNIASEVQYSSIYNENGDDHTKAMINIEPGETISYTTIMLGFSYDLYEKDILYYGVDYRGGQQTIFFIEWDMTKDGGGL